MKKIYVYSVCGKVIEIAGDNLSVNIGADKYENVRKVRKDNLEIYFYSDNHHCTRIIEVEN